MAGDVTTIARPYAEAVFRRALETDKLALWSDMLDLLVAVAQDEALHGLLTNPKLTSAQKTDIMLEVSGGRLNDEGQNLVKLLAANNRLNILPELAHLYNQNKAAHEGIVDVQVTTAYALKPAQEKLLADALQAKLGRTVNIQSEQDDGLIGGFKLRAGDMVIDGSVQGQLHQMTHELGI